MNQSQLLVLAVFIFLLYVFASGRGPKIAAVFGK